MRQAQQLGRYQLLDRIAFGGMAEIFRAKTFDAEGKVHLVAVKRVLDHLVEDDEFVQMIVDEAKVSALLHHPNIARLYEFAHAGREYFLAIEYVDGKDLRAVMERLRALGRLLPCEHAAWVALSIAEALHAAHTQRDGRGEPLRLVHRDVSPSNLLCSYRGEVKLCDFGIAKATLTRIQTRTGVIKGKVRYMSPEQAMGRKLDHRSDLFSLGTVLYEALTLTPPFQAPSEVDLIFAVREARKPPIATLRSDVPPELAAIIDRAMAPARSARYQSGAELAADLRAFLDAFSPGYQQGQLGQLMRQLFHTDMELEQRQLDEYVLHPGDETLVGENLIADVLDADAPYRRFLPTVRSGNTVVVRVPPPQPGRPQRAAAGAAPRGGIHDEQTGPRAEAAAPSPSFHEESTARKQLVGEAADLHEAQTDRSRPPAGMVGGGDELEAEPPLDELHGLPTRLIVLDDAARARLRDPAIRDAGTPPPIASEPTVLFRRPTGEGAAVDDRAAPPPPGEPSAGGR